MLIVCLDLNDKTHKQTDIQVGNVVEWLKAS